MEGGESKKTVPYFVIKVNDDGTITQTRQTAPMATTKPHIIRTPEKRAKDARSLSIEQKGSLGSSTIKIHESVSTDSSMLSNVLVEAELPSSKSTKPLVVQSKVTAKQATLVRKSLGLPRINVPSKLVLVNPGSTGNPTSAAGPQIIKIQPQTSTVRQLMPKQSRKTPLTARTTDDAITVEEDQDKGSGGQGIIIQVTPSASAPQAKVKVAAQKAPAVVKKTKAEQGTSGVQIIKTVQEIKPKVSPVVRQVVKQAIPVTKSTTTVPIPLPIKGTNSPVKVVIVKEGMQQPKPIAPKPMPMTISLVPPPQVTKTVSAGTSTLSSSGGPVKIAPAPKAGQASTQRVVQIMPGLKKVMGPVIKVPEKVQAIAPLMLPVTAGAPIKAVSAGPSGVSVTAPKAPRGRGRGRGRVAATTKEILLKPPEKPAAPPVEVEAKKAEIPEETPKPQEEAAAVSVTEVATEVAAEEPKEEPKEVPKEEVKEPEKKPVGRRGGKRGAKPAAAPAKAAADEPTATAEPLEAPKVEEAAPEPPKEEEAKPVEAPVPDPEPEKTPAPVLPKPRGRPKRPAPAPEPVVEPPKEEPKVEEEPVKAAVPAPRGRGRPAKKAAAEPEKTVATPAKKAKIEDKKAAAEAEKKPEEPKAEVEKPEAEVKKPEEKEEKVDEADAKVEEAEAKVEKAEAKVEKAAAKATKKVTKAVKPVAKAIKPEAKVEKVEKPATPEEKPEERPKRRAPAAAAVAASTSTKKETAKKVVEEPAKKSVEEPAKKTGAAAKPIPEDKADLFSRPVPSGWSRDVIQRKSGKSAGKYDVYVFSPDGQKHRSRADILRYLTQSKGKYPGIKPDDFDFSVAKESPPPSKQKVASPPEKSKAKPPPAKRAAKRSSVLVVSLPSKRGRKKC
ncbi:Hypothetical predicted protein [Cloeon dipterum]|uniref:MBD domain-containing protein n=1 Tax=Cloeon dipterum TaxID=197152 RepID=A0A8S1DR68_9INSE|nr:Hypothetical predicted protein [Cloeon dipterum]